MTTGVQGIPIGGPGAPEPPRAMVARQWSVAVHSNTYGTFRIFFFRLIDGRMMCYNPSTKSWKVWRPKKNLVIGKTITISQAKRAVNKLQTVRKVADAIFPVKHSTKVKTKR